MNKYVNQYQMKELIKKGDLLTVHKMWHRSTESYYAVKVVGRREIDREYFEQFFMDKLNDDDCEHIVGFSEMLVSQHNVYFIFEYCNGGTLNALIQHSAPFPQQVATRFLGQLLQAFRIINGHGLIHRDIKPQNIFLHNGDIKIYSVSFSKFNEAKNNKGSASVIGGGNLYRAPEVMMGEVYSSKADVWSMGVVFYEMLFGVIPFPYKSIPEFLNLLKKQPISIPHSPKISPTCQQFLKEVLAANPDQRIGWEEMFSKYWVTEEGELMRKGEMTNTQEKIIGDRWQTDKE